MQSLTDNQRLARMNRDGKPAATGSENKSIEYYSEPRRDIQALIAAPGKRILDVGCAAGELGFALKQAGAREVIGIESSTAAAALAQDKLDGVLVGDAQSPDWPLAQSSFDYIIFADVLEHLVDPWSALASFSRYLQADGRVVASIPNLRFYLVIARLIFNAWGYRESGILDSTHLRFFTLPTIRDLFARAGLRIEKIERTYRLFEDQSRIGRLGALASRLFCRFVAPLVGRDFFTFQYLIVARKADD
ncbi:MAG: hypothetical protein V7641_5362 [Blastocatellia bacterium]